MAKGSGRLIGTGERHVEILWNPVSTNHPVLNSDYINMRDWDHATLLIHFGAIATGLDSDLTVIADSANSSTDPHTLATINYRLKKSTAAWGEMTSVTDSKIDIVAGGEIVPSTDDNTVLAIEIDTAELNALHEGMDHFYVSISDGGAYAYVSSAVAILSKGRYSYDPPASAL
jgi:hypothetical protein